MLTIYIENTSNDKKALMKTIQSLEPLMREIPGAHHVVLGENDFHTFGDIIREDKSEYVYFMQAGDVIKGSISNLVTTLSSRIYAIIATLYVSASTGRYELPFSPCAIDIKEMPQFTPSWRYCHFFRRETFKTCMTLTNEELLYDVYMHTINDTSIFYDTDVLHYCEVYYENNPRSTVGMSRSWYFDLNDKLLAPLAAYADDTKTPLPVYLQYVLGYHIWCRFKQNMNNGDKHVIDEEYPQFIEQIKAFLPYISDNILLYGRNMVDDEEDDISRVLKNRYALPMHFAVSMLQLKYGSNYTVSYEVITDNSPTVYAKVGDALMQDLSQLKCNIDLVEYDPKSEALIIEYHIDDFVQLDNLTLKAYCNDSEFSVEETYRYAHTKYFGVSAQKPRTYRSVISMPSDISRTTQKRYDIYWTLSYRDVTLHMPINAKHYCARINTKVYKSFWKFEKNLLTLNDNNDTLHITPARGRMLWRELVFFLYNFRPHIATRIFGIRTLYWITRPWMKNKTIWLTYDKLYKGGDCGEYLYRYACTRQKETGIIPAYVINGDADDYKRLIDEGYQPLKYKSLKHLIYYLNSSVVFTTHGGVYNFNGLTKASVQYVQNLLHHDVACIQHGLTVQQLAHNSNRLFNNMKRYYCASKYEVSNLSHPVYGYENKSILKLTGIPRYDGLVNSDKHQILITPTWRNYIALPAGAKNEAKPYFAGFKDTDYFKIYNTLLTDERLIATAKRTGYKLIYLLHPVISAQLRDYPQNESVEIVPSLTVNYEKILRESSLMVTDYSGVQFDFAYMRKPVIYYHPDELPPHYKEGGFFYDTMGFGEICKKHDEIVSVLCDYMENNCEIKEFYLERENDFFAYDDLNSCQRIYDDMLAYQKEKGQA